VTAAGDEPCLNVGEATISGVVWFHPTGLWGRTSAVTWSPRGVISLDGAWSPSAADRVLCPACRGSRNL